MITEEIIGSEEGGVASRISIVCSDFGCPGIAEPQLGILPFGTRYTFVQLIESYLVILQMCTLYRT